MAMKVEITGYNLYKPDVIDEGNIDGAFTIWRANFGKLRSCDEQAKNAGVLVGRYISHPFADGRAYYQIVKENRLKVTIKVCTGLGDDWELPAWGEECEINRSLAEEFIEQREGLERIFSNLPEHSCEENKVANCDGEFHHNFCGICNKDMGTENCND